MNKTKYFIRIKPSLSSALVEYLEECKIVHIHVSNEWSATGSTELYSIQMDTEEAMAIRLKFPLIGFLSFDKVFKKQTQTTQEI